MTDVVLEIGPKKRVFATAVDWPGWCRSGRDEQGALAALADYAPRYAPVAQRAGLAFDGPGDLHVVERVTGGSTTDFGAPGAVAGWDAQPLDAPGAQRRAELTAAAWATFDRVVAGAPETLRKGPRGGGRDRDQVVAHVRGAQRAFARKIGVKRPEPTDDAAEAEMREAILMVLREPSPGDPPVPKGWPVRYAAARMAWHVLDHAWEIEDKSEPAAS